MCNGETGLMIGSLSQRKREPPTNISTFNFILKHANVMEPLLDPDDLQNVTVPHPKKGTNRDPTALPHWRAHFPNLRPGFHGDPFARAATFRCRSKWTRPPTSRAAGPLPLHSTNTSTVPQRCPTQWRRQRPRPFLSRRKQDIPLFRNARKHALTETTTMATWKGISNAAISKFWTRASAKRDRDPRRRRSSAAASSQNANTPIRRSRAC